MRNLCLLMLGVLRNVGLLASVVLRRPNSPLRPLTVFVALATLFACAVATRAETPSPPERSQLPAEVIPERYDIEVEPNAQALTFAGKVRITINVRTATDRIVLNAADLTFGQAALSNNAEVPMLMLDETLETAAFIFKEPVTPGRYVLSIDYAGKIYQQVSGFFAIDYDTPAGKRRALFTQFQNADARRFVPSWDEPARKAVFSLTVVAPQGEMAISNMPVAETTGVDGERVKIRFADSPLMSSYLLFLGLGDLERLAIKTGDVEVGVVAVRGEVEKGKFGLDAAIKLLDYYNDYFDVPYPLPKLDLVAVPGQSQFFGAMENWGAICYLDRYLLLDPKLSTDRDRQDVFIVVAHEIAHQWFGNLVTMAWWDDLWLNEGFASWMENKATDHFHPEWKVWLDTAADQQAAMDIDARSGTHPVITPIRDVFEAAGAFDTITYSKGQAVVRMLEAYVGEAAFRLGARRYIKKNAYKNTVSDDLWGEIAAASSLPVIEIAHDFTLQPGVPLIRVEQAENGLKLSQSRFASDETSPPPQVWRIPARVKAAGDAPWRGIVHAAAPTLVSESHPGGAIVNFGQTGYFRTTYDPAQWASLSARFAIVAPDDQLGLLYDSFALGEAGVTPMSDFLDLANHADAAAEPLVLGVLGEKLGAIDYYYEGLPGRAAYRVFARGRLNPVLARLGWDARPGETDNEGVLRGNILVILGDLDDAVVIEEARRRFAAYLANPNSLTGSTRRSVLNIVASHADAEMWEQVHQLARAAMSPTDEARLYSLLGTSHDPVLAARAMALALSDEPPATVRPGIIAAVAAVFPELAFDFALANREAVAALLEPNSRWSYFARLAQESRNVVTAEKLAAFSEAHVPETARSDVTKAISAIRYRAKIIATRLPDIDRWIAARRD
jgi:aminopeptidase N